MSDLTELSGPEVAFIERRLQHLRRHPGARTREAAGLAELLLTEVHRLRLAEARANADRAYYDHDDEGDT